MDSKSRFEPLANARHSTEFINGTEWTVVRARRNWFALPFLCFWLAGWTFGGAAAMYSLFTADVGAKVFLVVWLGAWALGWMFAAGSILWQIGGRSMVAVAEGALIHGWRMPLLAREKRYDPAQVQNLRVGDTGGLFGWGRSMGEVPPFLPSISAGSVKFDYGARTIQLFPGLDESEGRMIVERLARNLPLSAVAGR